MWPARQTKMMLMPGRARVASRLAYRVRSVRELSGGLQPLFDFEESKRLGVVNQATPEAVLPGTETDFIELRDVARRSFDKWAAPGRPAETSRDKIERLLITVRAAEAKRLTQVLQQP